MASIFKLFADAPAATNPAAGTAATPPAKPVQTVGAPDRIHYDPRLVGELMQDHVNLVSHFTALMPLMRDGDIRGFRSQLASFKTEFQGHIIKENVKFYVYLEQSLAGDETNIELMRDFRREMNAISRAVVGFCNKYMDAEMSTTTIRNFEQESGEIAAALLSRIEREERDLYALYH